MSKLTQIIERFKDNMKKTGSFAIFIPQFYYGMYTYPGNNIDDLILLAPRIIGVLLSPLSLLLFVGSLGLAAPAAIAQALFFPFQCLYAKIYDACEPIDDVSFDTFEKIHTTDTSIGSDANITGHANTSNPESGTNDQPPVHHPSLFASENNSSLPPPAEQHIPVKPPTEPGRAPAPGGI